jgi:hypothetical protein
MLTLYHFKVNDTTLEYFKVNIHGKVIAINNYMIFQGSII